MIKIKLIKKLHSFSLDCGFCKTISISDINKLYNISDFILKKNSKFIVIGNGTNSIFIENFKGIILINKIYGIKVYNYPNYWKLHINSGENWENVVKFTLKNNIFGLENLAMIPGKIGSSPIYNIGAYGSEFKNFCIYVDILNFKNNKIIRFNKDKCKFSYRNSIFQKMNQNSFYILSIGLKIYKKWIPNISHKIFNEIKINKNINPKKIFNFICKKRNENIPNYKEINNSGSIFKNPVINYRKLNKIKFEYNNVPYIKEKKNKYRISAGWLIEKCNLKNFRIGNLKISDKNAIIILNLGEKNAQNLSILIKFIYYKVIYKFNIKLELEVSLISNSGKLKIENLI